MQLKSPKLLKFKKYHKGRVASLKPPVSNFVSTVGDYCIITAEPARISARQLEAVRKSIRKTLKRSGKLWIPVFPQVPVTAKPLEVRMGKGKGSVSYWVAKAPAGTIIAGLSNVSFRVALKALCSAQTKLPVRSKLLINQVALLPKSDL